MRTMLIGFLCVFSIFVTPIAAQETPESFSTYCDRQFVFRFPHNWVVDRHITRMSTGTLIRVANSQATLYRPMQDISPGDVQSTVAVFTREYIQPEADLGIANDITEITRDFSDRFWERASQTPGVTIHEVSTQVLDGYSAASRIASLPTIDWGMILVDLGNDYFGAVLFMTGANEYQDWLSTFLTMAASIEVSPSYFPDSICANSRVSWVDPRGHFEFRYPSGWIGEQTPFDYARVQLRNAPDDDNDPKPGEVSITVDIVGGGTVEVFGDDEPMSILEVARLRQRVSAADVDEITVNGEPAALIVNEEHHLLSIYQLHGYGMISRVTLSTLTDNIEAWLPLAVSVAETIQLSPNPEQCEEGRWPNCS